MIAPFDFVLVFLCAYRLTRFFVFDSLVGANLESRSKFSRRLDSWGFTQDGHDKSWVRGKIAGLLVCPFCLGFWLSLGSWAAWVWGPEWARYVIVAWAVAGAQSLVSILERRISKG